MKRHKSGDLKSREFLDICDRIKCSIRLTTSVGLVQLVLVSLGPSKMSQECVNVALLDAKNRVTGGARST